MNEPCCCFAGSKGGGVSAYQQQYLGYSGPVGEAPYSLQGLLPRPAPPASSYYSYQPPNTPQPTYPLQFTQPAQSSPFNSQFLSSAQLQVAAAVQHMQVRKSLIKRRFSLIALH